MVFSESNMEQNPLVTVARPVASKIFVIAVVLFLVRALAMAQNDSISQPRYHFPNFSPELRKLPDLYISYSHIKELDDGARSITIEDMVCNQGEGRSDVSFIRYYLMSSEFGLIYECGSRLIKALNQLDCDENMEHPNTYARAGDIPNGDYYLIAVVNPGQLQLETNYSNNKRILSERVIHVKNIDKCPHITPDFVIRPEDFCLADYVGGERVMHSQVPENSPKILEISRNYYLEPLIEIMNFPTHCNSVEYEENDRYVEVDIGLIRLDDLTHVPLGIGYASYNSLFFGGPNIRVPLKTAPGSPNYLDRLTISSYCRTGDYWMYLLIDPHNEFVEISKSNNVIFSSQIIRLID